MPHGLVVDADHNSRDSMADLARASGYTVAVAGDLREARLQWSWQEPDVVIARLALPDGKGTELLDERAPGGQTAVIILAGQASVESAVDALRNGALDYLVEPIDASRVRQLLAQQALLAPDSAFSASAPIRLMPGRSEVMRQLHRKIARVAPTDAAVLLIGESGSGKEVAAKSVHDLSRRCDRSFLALNCGAISPMLVESELFGHERGSFTGAERQHRGYFERADRGTLFLDEITEMPLDLQTKLLRVMETGSFFRVGTDRETSTNVRIVAATNRDPLRAIAEGRLRTDLYYRLNVFPLRIPPLRDRPVDIEQLALHFLRELNRAQGLDRSFAAGWQDSLLSRQWPGNVRELRNCIHRAFILADDSIGAEHLQEEEDAVPLAGTAGGKLVGIPLGTSLAEADRQLIQATLESCQGVRKTAAGILGISLKTLYNKLHEYGDAGAPSPGTRQAGNPAAD